MHPDEDETGEAAERYMAMYGPDPQADKKTRWRFGPDADAALRDVELEAAYQRVLDTREKFFRTYGRYPGPPPEPPSDMEVDYDALHRPDDPFSFS